MILRVGMTTMFVLIGGKRIVMVNGLFGDLPFRVALYRVAGVLVQSG